MDKLAFAYSPSGALILSDVSFEVAPGQVIAIVGASGSGKSTLASLLAGLYQPTSGRVLFDDVDLATVDLRSVRRQVGVVVQSPYLFAASIRANIALAEPDLPLDAICEAAKTACIHDEIVAMRLGYETVLHDRGASLSGGQRQRLALARALANRPQLLLLDEATRSVDPIIEAKISQQLSKLGCTRIVITHRVSTVIDADQVLVMQGGRIVQRGTSAELRADRDGAYYRLFSPHFQRESDFHA